MWKESEELRKAIDNLIIKYSLLDNSSADKLRETVYSRFTKNRGYQYPLWEQLAVFKGVIFDFAWEWLGDLLRNDKVIVFFEEANDKAVFLLNDGGILPNIMNECPPMTFYVTNEHADFLFAYHSDHSIFRVSGNAQEKFEKYIRNNKINVSIHTAS